MEGDISVRPTEINSWCFTILVLRFTWSNYYNLNRSGCVNVDLTNKKSWMCSVLFQGTQEAARARKKRREKHETWSACRDRTSIYIFFKRYFLIFLRIACHWIINVRVMWFYATSWLRKSNKWLSCEIQYLSLWWKRLTQQFILVFWAG